MPMVWHPPYQALKKQMDKIQFQNLWEISQFLYVCQNHLLFLSQRFDTVSAPTWPCIWYSGAVDRMWSNEPDFKHCCGLPLHSCPAQTSPRHLFRQSPTKFLHNLISAALHSLLGRMTTNGCTAFCSYFHCYKTVPYLYLLKILHGDMAVYRLQYCNIKFWRLHKSKYTVKRNLFRQLRNFAVPRPLTIASIVSARRALYCVLRSWTKSRVLVPILRTVYEPVLQILWW